MPTGAPLEQPLGTVCCAQRLLKLGRLELRAMCCRACSSKCLLVELRSHLPHVCLYVSRVFLPIVSVCACANACAGQRCVPLHARTSVRFEDAWCFVGARRMGAAARLTLHGHGAPPESKARARGAGRERGGGGREREREKGDGRREERERIEEERRERAAWVAGWVVAG